MLWYVGYVVLFVDDLDPLIEFYAKKVGFPIRLRAEGYAEFAVEGAKFALLARSRMTEILGKEHTASPSPNAHQSAVTMLVDDVDRTFRELSGRGVPFLGSPADRPHGFAPPTVGSIRVRPGRDRRRGPRPARNRTADRFPPAPVAKPQAARRPAKPQAVGRHLRLQAAAGRSAIAPGGRPLPTVRAPAAVAARPR